MICLQSKKRYLKEKSGPKRETSVFHIDSKSGTEHKPFLPFVN